MKNQIQNSQNKPYLKHRKNGNESKSAQNGLSLSIFEKELLKDELDIDMEELLQFYFDNFEAGYNQTISQILGEIQSIEGNQGKLRCIFPELKEAAGEQVIKGNGLQNFSLKKPNPKAPAVFFTENQQFLTQQSNPNVSTEENQPLSADKSTYSQIEFSSQQIENKDEKIWQDFEFISQKKLEESTNPVNSSIKEEAEEDDYDEPRNKVKSEHVSPKLEMAQRARELADANQEAQQYIGNSNKPFNKYSRFPMSPIIQMRNPKFISKQKQVSPTSNNNKNKELTKQQQISQLQADVQKLNFEEFHQIQQRKSMKRISLTKNRNSSDEELLQIDIEKHYFFKKYLFPQQNASALPFFQKVELIEHIGIIFSPVGLNILLLTSESNNIQFLNDLPISLQIFQLFLVIEPDHEKEFQKYQQYTESNSQFDLIIFNFSKDFQSAFHLIKTIIDFEQLVNQSNTLQVIIANPEQKQAINLSKFNAVFSSTELKMSLLLQSLPQLNNKISEKEIKAKMPCDGNLQQEITILLMDEKEKIINLSDSELSDLTLKLDITRSFASGYKKFCQKWDNSSIIYHAIVINIDSLLNNKTNQLEDIIIKLRIYEEMYLMKRTFIIGVSLEGHSFSEFPDLYGLNCFLQINQSIIGWQKTVIQAIAAYWEKTEIYLQLAGEVASNHVSQHLLQANKYQEQKFQNIKILIAGGGNCSGVQNQSNIIIKADDESIIFKHIKLEYMVRSKLITFLIIDLDLNNQVSDLKFQSINEYLKHWIAVIKSYRKLQEEKLKENKNQKTFILLIYEKTLLSDNEQELFDDIIDRTTATSNYFDKILFQLNDCKQQNQQLQEDRQNLISSISVNTNFQQKQENKQNIINRLKKFDSKIKLTTSNQQQQVQESTELKKEQQQEQAQQEEEKSPDLKEPTEIKSIQSKLRNLEFLEMEEFKQSQKAKAPIVKESIPQQKSSQKIEKELADEQLIEEPVQIKSISSKLKNLEFMEMEEFKKQQETNKQQENKKQQLKTNKQQENKKQQEEIKKQQQETNKQQEIKKKQQETNKQQNIKKQFSEEEAPPPPLKDPVEIKSIQSKLRNLEFAEMEEFKVEKKKQEEEQKQQQQSKQQQSKEEIKQQQEEEKLEGNQKQSMFERIKSNFSIRQKEKESQKSLKVSKELMVQEEQKKQAQVVQLKGDYESEFTILFMDDSQYSVLQVLAQKTKTKIIKKIARNYTDGKKLIDEFYGNNKLFHLLLIDIEMPNDDGLKLVKEIRQEEEKSGWKKSWIIGIKQQDDERDEEQLIEEYKFDDLRVKPFQIKLQEFTEELIERNLKEKEDCKEQELKGKFQEQISVLFIDDNLYWILSVRAQKTTEKINLQPCRSVNEGFDKYTQGCANGFLFDCILLDLIMPEENGGFQFLKKLRDYETQNLFKKSFVIGMKETDEERTDQELLEQGLDDLMVKPFQIRLQEVLEMCKTRRQQQLKPVVQKQLLGNVDPTQFKVLFVDDSQYNILNFLYQKGVETKKECARSQNEAMDKYNAMLENKQIYHVILMDIDLSESGSGIEFTKQIRIREEKEGIRRTIIIGIRQADEEELEQQGLEAGMDDVRVKPFQIQLTDIVQWTNDLLNKSKGTEEEQNQQKKSQEQQKQIEEQKADNQDYSNCKVFDDFTILIIDDNQYQILQIMNQQSTPKAKFVYAKTGTLAFEKYTTSLKTERRLYNLILVDTMMPDDTGLNFHAKVREFEKQYKVQRSCIIAMKDTDDEIGDGKYLSDGFDDVRIKPFQIKMQEIISWILSGAKEKIPAAAEVKKGKLRDGIFCLLVADNDTQFIQNLNNSKFQDFSAEQSSTLNDAIKKYSIFVERRKNIYHAIMISMKSKFMGIEIAKFIRQYEYENNISKSFIIGLTTPDDDEDNFFNGFNLFISKTDFSVQTIMKKIISEIEINQKDNLEFNELKAQLIKINNQ